MLPELAFLAVVIMAASISSAVLAFIVREEGDLMMMIILMFVVTGAFTLSALPPSSDSALNSERDHDWWSHHIQTDGR